jgi:uncharacterized protein YjbI with pentapeptide repeats
MNLSKKIAAIVSETIRNPLSPSYVVDKNGKQIVLRPGGNYVGFDLSGLDLTGVRLTGVNFTNANLSGVNLSGAHLEEANLAGADLSGANLSGAHLEGANIGSTALQEIAGKNTPAGLASNVVDTLKSGG